MQAQIRYSGCGLVGLLLGDLLAGFVLKWQHKLLKGAGKVNDWRLKRLSESGFAGVLRGMQIAQLVK
jgi:hypothetical protein